MINKKQFPIFIIALLSSTLLTAQAVTLQKLWETDTLLTTCESVLYAPKQQILYVSNIEGVPAAKDGKGSIAKVGLDGKIINARWVTGLNAPKGMGLHKNTLWVNDLDEVVAINIKTGSIKQRVKIEGGKFLNDLTISKNGIIYTSDSDTKKVHRIKNGKVNTYLDNLQRPNGLLALGNVLYVLDSGKLLKVDKDQNSTVIAQGMQASTDGIVQLKPNEFLVSAWAGVIYSVKSDGSTQQLLDTRGEQMNTADIDYNENQKVLYIPAFYKNKILAYEVK